MTSAAADDYAILAEGMRVRHGARPVVRDLSLRVPRGSIYGLTGPSGSGKTTTIRALATLQPLEAGTVVVDGIDARSAPRDVRARIGYLPDSGGVYEHLTAGEYLAFYGGIQGIRAPRLDQLVGELLELVDLTAQRNAPLRSLSRGRRQQLAVARCLLHDPPVLLLDEPAAGLDTRARLELHDILQELSRLHKTVVVASNLLPELAEVCTHLAILREGSLLAEGSVADILELVPAEARLRVQLLDPQGLGRARGVLRTHPACGEMTAESGTGLLVQFSGTRADLAGILADLVAAGLQVTDFGLEGWTVEDTVLRLTGTDA